MTTYHVPIEGILDDLGIDRPGDCEVIGASANSDGSITLSIRDLSDITQHSEDQK